MAEAKNTGRAVVPQSSGGASDDIDTALRGVEGKVRKAIVERLRKLVEKNPEAFVRNMRVWMDQGRENE
ncbi:MAG TPA: hypothetical protein VMB81_18050 [Candidatus Sulfotelmatobacter sp.]|nr:hypothetical protein [Candidatus Sulfotelmatobacter sp.]